MTSTPKKPRPMSASAKRELKGLMQRPLSELSFDEIDGMFAGLAELGRREGLRSLEDMVKDMDDRFLTLGIRLAVDETEPELIRLVLSSQAESLLREQEIKYRKVLEGVVSVREGDNPRIVELKLKSLY